LSLIQKLLILTTLKQLMKATCFDSYFFSSKSICLLTPVRFHLNLLSNKSHDIVKPLGDSVDLTVKKDYSLAVQ